MPRDRRCPWLGVGMRWENHREWITNSSLLILMHLKAVRSPGVLLLSCVVALQRLRSHSSLPQRFDTVAWVTEGQPHAGFGVVRIDPLRFQAGYRKKRLNQALSVLSLSLGFL